MKTGYMIMRYMTKKQIKNDQVSHIITPMNFVVLADEGRHGIYMDEMKATDAFETTTNQVLKTHETYEEDISERTSDTRVFHDKENGYDYVYRLETILVQE